METWLLWVVVGFGLVIAELLTGTFYLLVIAVGFFAAAVSAWLDANFIVQAIVGSVIAIGGAWLVHHWHEAQRSKDGGKSNLLDRGQAVVLEGWTNESAGIARVRYRGASWDARLAPGAEKPDMGTTLYIEGQEGSMLVIAASRPAS
jgi:membrane protein implicated in regulation of membrane protease activity